MFQSSGLFKQVPCPFFKHDLCHRPYCHFKHVKPKPKATKEKELGCSETLVNAQLKNATKKQPVEEPSLPVEAVSEDVMNIVKNIPSSTLAEYAKRKQEVKELQETLEKVDKETESLGKSNTLYPDDDVRRGLIDSFYSKAKVPVNIISGDIKGNENKQSLNDITEALGPIKERKICHCDDPDCSGFIEDGVLCDADYTTDPKTISNEMEHLSSIDLSKVDDDYSRRKLERRLERKKKMLFDSGNLVKKDTNDGDFDQDLCDYIEKCKREYLMKKAQELSEKHKEPEKCKEGIEKLSEEFNGENERLSEKCTVEKVISEKCDIQSEKISEKCNDKNKKLSEKCKGEKELPEQCNEEKRRLPEKCKNVSEMISDKYKEGEKLLEKNKEETSTLDKCIKEKETLSHKSEEVSSSLSQKFEEKEKVLDENIEGEKLSEKCKENERLLEKKEEESKNNLPEKLSEKCEGESVNKRSTEQQVLKNISKISEKVETSLNNHKEEHKVREKLSEKSKDVYEKIKNKTSSEKSAICKTVTIKAIDFFSRKVPQTNLINHDSGEDNSDIDCDLHKQKRQRQKSTDGEGSVITTNTEDLVPKKKKMKEGITHCEEKDNLMRKNNKKNPLPDDNTECVNLSKKKKRKEEQGSDGKDYSVEKRDAKKKKEIEKSSIQPKNNACSSSGISIASRKMVETKELGEKSGNYVEEHLSYSDVLKKKKKNDMDEAKMVKSKKSNKDKSRDDFEDSNEVYRMGEKPRKKIKNDIHGIEKRMSVERMRTDSEGSNTSCAFDLLAKYTDSERRSSTERIRTDSEASDTSRSAFDVITIDSDHEVSDDIYDNTNKAKRLLNNYHRSISHEHEMEDVSDVRRNHTEETSISLKGPVDPKKRVALSKEEVHRKTIIVQKPKRKTEKMSYVSPSLTGKSTAPAKTTMTSSKEAIKKTGANAENFYNDGKRRIAHVQQEVTPDKEEYPKLPVEIGGKVPHIIRQKYFDKIIDEFIPKVASRKEAIAMAFKEEADAYQRSTRKQIYMSISANIIKRIRSMPDYTPPIEQVRGDPMIAGQPTTKVIQVQGDPMIAGQPTTKVISRIKSSVISGYKKLEKVNKSNRNASKKSIKPASSNLINAAAAIEKISHAKLTTAPSPESVALTESNFYDHMQQYLLTDELLFENKYPYRDEDNPELAKIKDYVASSNVLKKTCCRCGKDYFMNQKGKYVTKEECHYHWGKQIRQRGRGVAGMVYTCCGAETEGLGTCSMCRLHVSKRNSELKGFVSTENCSNVDSRRKVFALDCEMCYTTQGLELTRLTVVDFDLEQIIDLFVKPLNPIVDYNTRFSGVTKEHLQHVTTNIQDIHDILLNLFDKETILLGHSLESDLTALNMIHRKVVDTSIVFPHRMGPPLKRALRNLMVDYLQKVIQSGESGHDSCEDARACMELMKYKFKEDKKKIARAIQKPLRNTSIK